MPGITTTELSRRIGRSRAAILKLVRNGTIPRNGDGTFDEAAVRYAYGRNTHPAWRKPLTPAAGDAGRPTTDPTSTANGADDPDTLIRRVLADEGRRVEGVISHDDARAAEAILRCRKLAQDIAATEREFIPAASVKRHLEVAFYALCKSVRVLPATYGTQMAAELGCDPERLGVALDRVIGNFLAGLSPPVIGVAQN